MVLLPLVEKEVKDLLRDPRILIPFIISALIMPVMAVVIGHFMAQEVAIGLEPINLGIVDFDQSNISKSIVSLFMSSEMKNWGINTELLELSTLEPKNIGKIVRSKQDLEALIIIPEGFGKNVTNIKQTYIVAIPIVRSIGFTGMGVASKAERVIGIIKEIVIKYISNKLGIEPEVIETPLSTIYMTYVTDKLLMGSPGVVLAGISMAAVMIPLIVMVIALSVAQMSATSMAVENEERTLETLLTFPVSRFNILMAKLLGSFTVAIIGSAFNLVGLYLYMLVMMRFMASVKPPIPTNQALVKDIQISIPIDISPMEFLIIGISLVFSLFFLSALGIVIGALSSDVRISSTLMGPLSIIVIIPAYIIAFADVEKLSIPVQVILFSLPFAQPAALIKKALMVNLSILDSAYLGASLALTLLMLLVVARIFTTEKILTLQKGIELRFRRKKKRFKT